LPEIARAGGVARLLEITSYEAWSCLLAGDRVHKRSCLLESDRPPVAWLASRKQ